MRLGLIARADNSGLGVQCWEFARHMKPARILVIDVGHLRNDTTHCNKATYRDRYSNATYWRDWGPSSQAIATFMRGLDVLFTMETPYNMSVFAMAASLRVRTILQYNYEFLPHIRDPKLPKPSLFAGPTRWRWDEVPFENKVHLPVPIATDRFADRPARRDGPRHFLHVVGRPAIMDRNGTPDLLAALRHVKSNIRLTLKCQDVEYLDRMLFHAGAIPDNVEIIVDSGDVRDYWDLYQEGDVFVMPRKFGGLCLPAQEAIGAGMPVIMTDIAPNNDWLPAEWLIPANKIAEFNAMNRVDVYAPHVSQLAAKIDQFAQDDDFYTQARIRATELSQQYSWETLKPLYQKVLNG